MSKCPLCPIVYGAEIFIKKICTNTYTCIQQLLNYLFMVSERCSELFNQAFSELDSLVDSAKFDQNYTIEFDLSDDCDEAFINLPRTPGIYYYSMKLPDSHKAWGCVKEDIGKFSEFWTGRDNVVWTPGIKAKRCNYHRAIQQDNVLFHEGWIPMYLGKSQNLYARIKQHYDQPSERASFGMKLKSRKTIFGIKIRVQVMTLSSKHSKTILPYVEYRLRDKLQPIIGQ